MIPADRSLIGMSRQAARPGASKPRPSALTAISTRAASNAASMTPCMLGSVRLKESSAPASTPRPASGSTAKITKCPGGGERAAQPAWRALGEIPIDKSAGDPAERSGGQRKRDHDRRHADLGEHGRSPMAPSQLPIRFRITSASTGSFAPDGGPQLRIENARRAGERSLREQLTPRRADARAEVVGFQQHGARGAQVGVEPVVPLLLVLELLGRDVRRRARLRPIWA